MSTPCNSLNVQLIKVSNLATYSLVKDADVLMIVENTGGSLYSRKAALSDLKSYVMRDGISGFTNNTFTSQVDSNTIYTYLHNNVNGGAFQYAHSYGTVPTLVRTVLVCTDPGGDGNFAENQEVDINAFFRSGGTNIFLPLCSTVSDQNYVTVSCLGSDGPSSTSTIGVYVNQTSPTSVINYNINLSKWKFKVYIWK